MFKTNYYCVCILSLNFVICMAETWDFSKLIGHKDGCGPGFKENCVDINECEEQKDVCSGHRCENRNGSYDCLCDENFILVNNSEGHPKRCLDINQSKTGELIYAEAFKIKSFQFDKNGPDTTSQNIKTLYTDALKPISIDYSFRGNYMAWTDTSSRTITIAPIHVQGPSFIIDEIVIQNLKKPNILSIDWMHDLIYWTESETNCINVIHISKPNEQHTLINTSNHEIPIRDFKVNVVDSCLVWTFVGSNPRIMRSLQDGTNHSILYSSDKQPFYITIDTYFKRYYFVDAPQNQLWSISFLGSDEKLIRTESYLNSLINSPVIYSDDVFVMTVSKVYTLNKFGGDHPEFEFGPGGRSIRTFARLYDFKIMDRILQPISDNKCRNSNCSYICLPSDQSVDFRCVCPANNILINYSICSEGGLANQGNMQLFAIDHEALIRSHEEKVSYFTKSEELVVLMIIVTLLFIILLTILTGYKINLSKIKTHSYVFHSNSLYEVSKREMDNKL